MRGTAGAILHEIFSGIQGEGVLVGFRQVFLRFHGCQLSCRYCDTPASRDAAPRRCLVETDAGRRTETALPNPLALPDVLAAVRGLEAGFRHHSISLTGGEPLLQWEFLDALLPELRRAGLRAYLETNGLLVAEMASLTTPPDFVAMDIKLPATAGGAPAWEGHAAFLEAALRQLTRAAGGGKAAAERLQVKLVFAEESLAEIAPAAQLIAACRADLPCVLQPVTPQPGGPPAPRPAAVLEAQRIAGQRLSFVRVIPQTHRMLGQR